MGKYSGFVVAISLAFLGVALGQQLTYDERCQILEGSGVRVDQCSSEKFLACKDGRCQCADPVNQIYTYREELIETRSKRSPKGGKGSTFKKVAVGAVAGAATYHVASQASKGFKGSFQTTEAPKKYKRVYACFSRVGGQCALNYNNWQSVDSSSSSTTTTSTTTTEAATTIPTSTVASENVTSSTNVTESTTTTSTTTTAAPTAAAQTQPLDISKIPKCIEHAVCKHGSPSQGNGTSTFLQKVDFDPRLGVCECEAGYERTSKDICVKVKRSGAAEKTVAGAVIIAALAFNKMFAF